MKKTLILALAALMLTSLPAATKGLTKSRTTKVAVVTDQKTYEAIGDDLDAFTASMSFIGKEGILIIDKWQHPDSLRTVLKHYYTLHNLEGAVLVGEIPIPMIRDAQHLTTAFKMDKPTGKTLRSLPTGFTTTSTSASNISNRMRTSHCCTTIR